MFHFCPANILGELILFVFFGIVALELVLPETATAMKSPATFMDTDNCVHGHTGQFSRHYHLGTED